MVTNEGSKMVKPNIQTSFYAFFFEKKKPYGTLYELPDNSLQVSCSKRLDKNDTIIAEQTVLVRFLYQDIILISSALT